MSLSVKGEKLERKIRSGVGNEKRNKFRDTWMHWLNNKGPDIVICFEDAI